jgi:hypothetical protein
MSLFRKQATKRDTNFQHTIAFCTSSLLPVSDGWMRLVPPRVPRTRLPFTAPTSLPLTPAIGRRAPCILLLSAAAGPVDGGAADVRVCPSGHARLSCLLPRRLNLFRGRRSYGGFAGRADCSCRGQRKWQGGVGGAWADASRQKRTRSRRHTCRLSVAARAHARRHFGRKEFLGGTKSQRNWKVTKQWKQKQFNQTKALTWVAILRSKTVVKETMLCRVVRLKYAFFSPCSTWAFAVVLAFGTSRPCTGYETRFIDYCKISMVGFGCLVHENEQRKNRAKPLQCGK